MKIITLSIPLFLLIAISTTCSKLTDNPITSRYHPDDWIASHGSQVTQDLADGDSSYCTFCHGEDLNGGTEDISCRACHLERSEACVPCHGGVIDDSGAPPFSLSGESSIANPGVGAHRVHLAGTAISTNVGCDQCHLVPEFSFSKDHFGSDMKAEVIFGALADRGGGAVYSFIDNTCSGIYCHGSFAGGYEDNTPLWTDAEGVQDSCGSCHYVSGPDAGVLGGRHRRHIERRGLGCFECHFATVDELNNIVGLDDHVNGINMVEFRLGGAWENQRCSNLDIACHRGNRKWD